MMPTKSDRHPFSVLMAGSALRLGVAAVWVGVLWSAVAWALAGSAP